MGFDLEVKYVHGGNPPKPLLVVTMDPPQRGFEIDKEKHDFIKKAAAEYPTALSEWPVEPFRVITGAHKSEPGKIVAAVEFPKEVGTFFVTIDFIRLAEIAIMEANLRNFQQVRDQN